MFGLWSVEMNQVVNEKSVVIKERVERKKDNNDSRQGAWRRSRRVTRRLLKLLKLLKMMAYNNVRHNKTNGNRQYGATGQAIFIYQSKKVPD